MGWLARIFSKTEIKNSGIYNSTINNIFWFTNPTFKVTESWLDSNLANHFNGEMAAKYIPELHQTHDFEKKNLQDILDFNVFLGRGLRLIDAVKEAVENFRNQHDHLYAIKESENLQFAEPEHELIIKARTLYQSTPKLIKDLKIKAKYLELTGYKIVNRPDALSTIFQPLNEIYSEQIVSLIDVFTRRAPSDHFIISDLLAAYNRIYRAIEGLNSWLRTYEKQRNHKIIHGIAGTGKTHTTAYLVQKLRQNGDFVIFLNAKRFNGDGVNFEECLHQLLDIPHGIRLGLTLRLLNKFAKKKKKRVFILFDALNETTKENLGFSDIWNLQLQQLINAIRTYPNLYFICTLRTSYLTTIWGEILPSGAVELTDIRKYDDVLSMCNKYFPYYNITVTNLDTANLSYFSVPLLLDLYCRLSNEDRQNAVSVSLNIKSYMQVFDNYVNRLINEVQIKRQLVAKQPIKTGLSESSDRFMRNIEAVLSVDEFVLAFDQPNTRLHDSIAEPMLEGYLLFIRDKISADREIVKHTQQQIGGYLLATRLAERYPVLDDLLTSDEFNEKLNGADTSLHHQLRLDILQFLILLKPPLVEYLTEPKALEAGWWFIFNTPDNIPQAAVSLVENPLSLSSLPFILQAGHRQRFDPAYPYNFDYIFRLLEKYELWDFDLNWTYYLYTNADELNEYISNSIERVKLKTQDPETESVHALYIAMIQATTVRELRDLATLHLIEFGKNYPLKLLSIVERTASLKDLYIYERSMQSLYGVVLIRQHDVYFIKEELPIIASIVFRLQFSNEAIHPKFNYIVIDSIKHILDFALINGVWKTPAEDRENIRLYRVPGLPHWAEPSVELLQSVSERDERNPPKPIGMDFAIYTIPRLLDNEKYELRVPAVANVLKRVYEIGYKADMVLPEADDLLKDFLFGHNIGLPGKVDRLSKKYNWKGLFDYAGVLLQQGLLDVYNFPGNPESGYHRLSDVGIDISNPNRDFKIRERIYIDNLIDDPEKPQKWTAEVKIETIETYFFKNFDGQLYIMLNGFVEQKVGGGYDSRSFIMTETCFIDKNEDFKELKSSVCQKVFDWERDLQLSPSYSTNTYFGEYYFADNQTINDGETYSIKTGAFTSRKRKVRPGDVLDGTFDMEEIGEVRETNAAKFLHFSGEDTLILYLNESDSEVFKGFSRFIPTVKIGKFLGLKADPTSGLILDSSLQQALVTVDYIDGDFKNEFVYLRADLAVAYMEAHNFALLYQNKQHSYSKNVGNSRFMKYAVIDQIAE